MIESFDVAYHHVKSKCYVKKLNNDRVLNIFILSDVAVGTSGINAHNGGGPCALRIHDLYRYF